MERCRGMRYCHGVCVAVLFSRMLNCLMRQMGSSICIILYDFFALTRLIMMVMKILYIYSEAQYDVRRAWLPNNQISNYVLIDEG